MRPNYPAHALDVEVAGSQKSRSELVLATGGDYSEDPMAQADMLTSYLKAVFAFMGFTDIRTVCASCTAYPHEVSGPAMERALVAAKAAGTSF